MNKLSLILATRNDNYAGDPMQRLQIVLEHVEKFAKNRPIEVIISDWGSEIPVAKVIKKYDFVKHVHHSKEVSDSFLLDFNEVLPLNAAARVATGNHIGRIDQDTILGPDFFDWYYETDHNEEDFYFCTKREMPKGVITIDKSLAVHDSKRPNSGEFWRDAVGIFLIPKELFHATRGYDEKNILAMHMEHDFVVRLMKVGNLVNLGPLIDWDTYHIWHSRDKAKNRPRNPHRSTAELKKLPAFVNDENWGIYNKELK
jgi:hypothetical protein